MGKQMKQKVHGNTRNAAKRSAGRLRQQAFRERQIEKAEEAEQFRIDYENLVDYQKKNNLVFFGELSPGENCQTAEEELATASLFATAMSLPPIRIGQTIRSYIQDVMRRWCEIGTPLLSLTTGTFAETVLEADPKRFEDRAEFVAAYEFPNGCDEPHEVAQ
jgi:hypothetical protein